MTLRDLAEDLEWYRNNLDAERISGSVPTVVCACVGYPNCCMYVQTHLEAMQRGAHIFVKMVKDLCEKKES